MLSNEDLERLITTKRREIEQEKIQLGLSENNDVDQKTYVGEEEKKVEYRQRALSESNALQNTNKNEEIPADLERYIRRYIGLPSMLKAGEFSPNNPLIREEWSGGDVLRSLGEYERRRNTLRRIRQIQYKEYLDQQAKKKQEAKEEAERKQKEREERERLKEEKERERDQERIDFRDNSPVIRRRSVSVVTNEHYVKKVDTGVQVDKASSPLSVAVQTDERDTFLGTLTQAERELSPRCVDRYDRRRSYGDCDDRARVTSVFDEDMVRMRNMRAEQEALERRRYYQKELQNQIIEQQRLRDERKNREKMLEMAEMRRLEEQLRSLKMAQDRDKRTHRERHAAMLDHALEYEKKRSDLQKDIDYQNNMLKIHTEHKRQESPKMTYYKEDKPYSTNIPDSSIFSENYDVENYLRRNLNPYKDMKKDKNIESRVKDRTVVMEKSVETKDKTDKFDSLIPVLRHSPKITNDTERDLNISEKMKIVDDKWQVPVVQKNILKSVNDKGKNISILTQLGSIRKQLQLEQMRLDKLTKE